ncbi:MAG: RluA family pseudouridine synthase [Kiritimatiellae bacterium]|nr:RluA family pseudouridine synthase [Kiritimatiellia bacterium]
MIERKQIKVNESGVRLDAVLFKACPSSSKALIRRAIEHGDILVNSRRTSKGSRLRGGETVEILRLLEQADNLVKPLPGAPLKCVFEDADLIAFDKPAGMPVQPLDCEETGTLMNAVTAIYPECRTVGDSPLMAGALHRIDADTSGLVLVARNEAAFENMRRQFSEHSVKKTYLALVEGAVATGGTLENDLVHDPTLPFCRMIDFKRNRLTRAQCEGLRPMHAVTRFTPIGRTMQENEERTLLEVTIYTGVTHQIRAQLALAGMHIVNDRLYGAFAVENQTGHCLHSLSASFRHPTFCTETEIRTNYPDWAIL